MEKPILCEVFAGEQDLFRKSGTSKKGQPYNMIRQTVYVKLPDERYPVGFNVVHFEEKDILSPGKYEIDVLASLSVNRFGDLEIRRPKLVPYLTEQKKAS